MYKDEKTLESMVWNVENESCPPLFLSNLSHLKDKHKGETIFIIGESEELNELSKNEILKISEQITIGVNFSSLIIPAKYHVCGHLICLWYANEFMDKSTIKIFHGRKQMTVFDKFENTFIMKCIYVFNDTKLLTHELLENTQEIIGCANVGLSSTHLAYILGAKRIVYVGFEYLKNSHHYNTNEKHKQTLLKNLDIIRKYRRHSWHKWATGNIEKVRSNLMRLPEELQAEKYPEDLLPAYQKYFELFSEKNIEIISTKKESVITYAGARYTELKKIITDKAKATF